MNSPWLWYTPALVSISRFLDCPHFSLLFWNFQNTVLLSVIACQEISADEYSHKSLFDFHNATFQRTLQVDDHCSPILHSYLLSLTSPASLGCPCHPFFKSSVYIILLKIHLYQAESLKVLAWGWGGVLYENISYCPNHILEYQSILYILVEETKNRKEIVLYYWCSR